MPSKSYKVLIFAPSSSAPKWPSALWQLMSLASMWRAGFFGMNGCVTGVAFLGGTDLGTGGALPLPFGVTAAGGVPSTGWHGWHVAGVPLALRVAQSAAFAAATSSGRSD